MAFRPRPSPRNLPPCTPADKITVLPTIKYDAAQPSDRVPGDAALARACGIRPEHPLLVGGSTGPGEEIPLLATYRALLPKFSALRLAMAPRHPEVVRQVVAAITAAGLTPVLRTERPDAAAGGGGDGRGDAETRGRGETGEGADMAGELTPSQVLVLNTMGELKKLYALAAVVFVGRSLVNLGGSDMIEVAALAKPCCFGPFTHNFAEAVELLTTAAGAVQLQGPGELTATVERTLADPAAAAAMGQRARTALAAQRGSTDKYVQELLSRVQRRHEEAKTHT